MKGAACVHRRHHSDHHTQPGCQRHCVDENLERREPLLGPGRHRKTTRPALGAGEWTGARGVRRGERGGRNADRGPFEAASRGPHYCGTCLEPLGRTTSPLSSSPVQTSGLRQAQYTKCSRLKPINRTKLLRSEILGLMSSGLDLMVSDDIWLV